jgi:hypothetical protein
MGPKKSPMRVLQRHHECQVMRHMLVKRGHLDAVTGAFEAQSEAWIERLCGVPLFSSDSRIAGKCYACSRGWAHPDNYPVGSERPMVEVNAS